MADIVDIAQDVIDARIEQSIKSRNRLPKESLPHCIECGIEIPMARRIAANAIRCIDCEQDKERFLY